jgi:type IV pilus assembly protein PilW
MAPIPIQRRQHGFSIVEIMVGVVIGMIAVLVIYQVFATSEGIKRNISAAGDAQQNGLLSSFMLGIEIANAGYCLDVAAEDLGC